MGYDIYSLLPNREAAMRQAKKYRSLWINDDGSYDEKAPDTVYFRLNIWGMPLLREFHEEIGLGEVNENLCDNSGNIIKDYECRAIADKIGTLDHQEVKDIMRGILIASEYGKDEPLAKVEEAAEAWTEIVYEWASFLTECAELKGCEVL